MKNQKYCEHKFCPYHQQTENLCHFDECQTMPDIEQELSKCSQELFESNILNLDEKRKEKK